MDHSGKLLGFCGKVLELGGIKLGSLAVTGENKVQRRANEQNAEAVHGDMMGKWRLSVNPPTPSMVILRHHRIKSVQCRPFTR